MSPPARHSAPGSRARALWGHLLRLLLLLILCVVALQIVFAARIAAMRWLDPGSTTFQRSEAARILQTQGRLPWARTWADLDQLGPAIQRAVIASEDAGFADHAGVEWDAVERAWDRNRRVLERPPAASTTRRPARLVGGSTLTQQLAKNLFLSPERTVARKAQELLLTWMLEGLLDKRRILEIYLNSVEWGEGLFGAQAAARHYFRVDARSLSPAAAAQLAVLLPAPRRYGRNPGSPYVLERAEVIAARMSAVALPRSPRP